MVAQSGPPRREFSAWNLSTVGGIFEPPISKSAWHMSRCRIHHCQPILSNCRVDITIFILYMGLDWIEPVGAWCRISSGPICCYSSPEVIQPHPPWFFARSVLKKWILIYLRFHRYRAPFFLNCGCNPWTSGWGRSSSSTTSASACPRPRPCFTARQKRWANAMNWAAALDAIDRKCIVHSAKA